MKKILVVEDDPVNLQILTDYLGANGYAMRGAVNGVDGIAAFHRERLMKVRDICDKPRTIAEVAGELFGKQDGYGTILAIEEAGAHVEYLHTLGKLRIANLAEVAKTEDPVLQYIRK